MISTFADFIRLIGEASKVEIKKLIIFTGVTVFIVFLLFPYIDANFFYYERVKNRVNILTGISNIDIEAIKSNEVLLAEYENILQEINEQKNNMVITILPENILPENTFPENETLSVPWIKFICAGSLWWICALLVLFADGSKLENLGISIVFIIIGTIFAFVGKIIPTLLSPFVNYIAYPLITIFIFVLLVLLGNEPSSDKQTSKQTTKTKQ